MYEPIHLIKQATIFNILILKYILYVLTLKRNHRTL